MTLDRNSSDKRYDGGNMFTVTEKASEMIKITIKSQKEPLSVRILRQAG